MYSIEHLTCLNWKWATGCYSLVGANPAAPPVHACAASNVLITDPAPGSHTYSGAYTAAGATDFNGIPATAAAGVKTFYVHSENFERTPADEDMPIIYSSVPPMEESGGGGMVWCGWYWVWKLFMVRTSAKKIGAAQSTEHLIRLSTRRPRKEL